LGQKVHPHGLRVGVIENWDSRWLVKNDKEFAQNVLEDHKIRNYLKKKLYNSGVSRIEIERAANRVRISIYTAKPGMVIGKGGTEVDKLKKELEELTGKGVSLNILEVRFPELDAQLVAENVASQLEKRISFRRAMKQAISRTMKAGAKGIKITCSGRLGGAEIARSEHYHEGTIPLQTLRANIDYGFTEAHTTYGRIGVKVWIYKGDVLGKGKWAVAEEGGNRHANAKEGKISKAAKRQNERRGQPRQ